MSNKRTVYVCCGTGCLANGSMKIYEELKKGVDKAKLDINVETIVKATGCNGICEKGPVVIVYPEGVWYGNVTPDDVEEIMDVHIEGGEVLERLAI